MNQRRMYGPVGSYEHLRQAQGLNWHMYRDADGRLMPDLIACDECGYHNCCCYQNRLDFINWSYPIGIVWEVWPCL